MSIRTLVLLPGMDGGDKLFGPLRTAAPPGVDTIAIGYPPGPRNDYGDLLPAVRAQLPADRPFFLLGWSFSGPLVLLAAAERPPGLRGVILAATFAVEIQKACPSVEIVDIDGPHLALVTNPAAAWAALSGFMDRVDAEG